MAEQCILGTNPSWIFSGPCVIKIPVSIRSYSDGVESNFALSQSIKAFILDISWRRNRTYVAWGGGD